MRISEQEREFHHKIAAQCFNKAWDLLDKKSRSNEDNLQMLYLSHASRYHWGLVGAPRNHAVGEWQLSRIYAALGQPQMALWIARSCLVTCRDNDLSDLIHTPTKRWHGPRLFPKTTVGPEGTWTRLAEGSTSRILTRATETSILTRSRKPKV